MLSVSQIALKVICIQLFMGFFFGGVDFVCFFFCLLIHTPLISTVTMDASGMGLENLNFHHFPWEIDFPVVSAFAFLFWPLES